MINKYVALDLETTGTNPNEDRIIEIGMAKVEDGVITESYSTFINPEINIPERITQLTGISSQDTAGKPVISEVIAEIIDFIAEYPILGHNVIFDYSFIKKAAVNAGLKFEKHAVDTLKLARRMLPEVEKKSLEYLCGHFGINPGNSHRAYDDAVSAMQLYYCLEKVNPQEPGLDELIEMQYSVKKDSPITAAQRRYLEALVIKHNVELEEPLDSLTKSKASKYIDGIISVYGK